MKSLLSILIIGISITAIAQIPPDSMVSIFRFTNFEEKMSANEKFNILKRLVSSKYFETYIRSTESYDFENYHILDINNDGLFDVFYDGREPDGIETNNLAIFLNDGDSLRLKVKLNGDIMSLQFKDKNLQKLEIMKSPCCDYHIYYIETFERLGSDTCFTPYINDDENYRYPYGEVNSTDYCFALNKVFRYLRGTEFPDNLTVKDTMHLNQISYVERLLQLGNNALERLIPENSKFYIISDTTITDVKYYFGFVKSEILSSIKYNKAQVFDYGWIKASHLEKKI